MDNTDILYGIKYVTRQIVLNMDNLGGGEYAINRGYWTQRGYWIQGGYCKQGGYWKQVGGRKN